MRYAHLASRLFGVPLLIDRNKMDAILAVIGPRLGIESPQAFGPGDSVEGKKRKPYYVSEDKIAVIEVIGPLVKRVSGDFMSGGPTTYGEIETEFTDAATDPEIKGILLLIDSPGGETVGAFELSDLIFSQRGSKPIIAVADGDAFSAAYAIASAADRIFLTKSGGVGSVGVYMMHIDQSGYNRKEGIKPTFIYAGDQKLMGNPHEPLSKDAKDVFQAEVDRVYGMFVETVARNRGMSVESVRQTEAGLFFGESGIEIGFADEIGTMSDAFAALRANLSGTRSMKRAAASAAQAKLKVEGNMNDPKLKAEDQKPVETTETPKDAAAVESIPDTEAPKPAAAASKVIPIESAAQIVELCCLAGMPKLASGFIKSGKSMEDIRGELVALKAKQDADVHIDTSTSMEAGSNSNRPVAESPLVKAMQKISDNAKSK